MSMNKCPFEKTMKKLGHGRSGLEGPCFCVGSHFFSQRTPSYRMSYVGKKGSLAAVYDDYSAGDFLRPLPFDGYIEGIVPLEERMYMLVSQPSYKVYVIDYRDSVLNSWYHSDSCREGYNKLTIVTDKVIVPDKSKKQLVVYSMEGQLLKHIDCPSEGTWTSVAICAADSESVIVSSTTTSTVFRVNIDSGEVMWTCTQVNLPGGVTCYGEEFVLVSRLSSTKTEISVLDLKTGSYLGKVMESTKRGRSAVPDLAMAGDALVVPRMDERIILCFELIRRL